MRQTQQEFLRILSAYQAIIHKVNLIYFRSEMDRQDNFQEIVFQLWRSFPTFKSKDRPASWIYAVAINTSISKVRKDSKLEFHESVPEFPVAEHSGHDDYNENYQRLMDALYRLNEIDKSIMLLYMEDYSYEEIAAIVGVSVSNIGVKIHRLKNQLQKQLNG